MTQQRDLLIVHKPILSIFDHTYYIHSVGETIIVINIDPESAIDIQLSINAWLQWMYHYNKMKNINREISIHLGVVRLLA